MIRVYVSEWYLTATLFIFFVDFLKFLLCYYIYILYKSRQKKKNKEQNWWVQIINATDYSSVKNNRANNKRSFSFDVRLQYF